MKFYIGSGLKNSERVNLYAKLLKQMGWEHTYNWTKDLGRPVDGDELSAIARQEQKGVCEADVVVILLPGGRGTHIELGMALALGKKAFLCAGTAEEFAPENMVSFYALPGVVRLIGTAEENVAEIWKACSKEAVSTLAPTVQEQPKKK